MRGLREWWQWRRERQLLKERLASAEQRVTQLQRHNEIGVQLIGMYLHELRLAHAALRRKGKALKMLHRLRHTKGGGDE